MTTEDKQDFAALKTTQPFPYFSFIFIHNLVGKGYGLTRSKLLYGIYGFYDFMGICRYIKIC